MSILIGDGFHDRVTVSGIATLAGELQLTLDDGFIPMPGESRIVFSAPTIQQGFDAVTFTNLPASVSWTIATGPTSISVMFNTACEGDTDGNNLVNFTDLNRLLDNWGTPGPIGDVDGSGSVNFADLNLLLDNWGADCN